LVTAIVPDGPALVQPDFFGRPCGIYITPELRPKRDAEREHRRATADRPHDHPGVNIDDRLQLCRHLDDRIILRMDTRHTLRVPPMTPRNVTSPDASSVSVRLNVEAIGGSGHLLTCILFHPSLALSLSWMARIAAISASD
jgi:hypothetical protein